MSPLHSPRAALLFALGAVLCACTHTPPGTSVEIALARKPEVIRLPATPAPALAKHTGGTSSPSGESAGGASEEKTVQVADAFSRAEFCMKAGKDQEAIAAFQEVVKLDPKFTEAWNNLAALYEKAGNEKQAMDAFKHAKSGSNLGVN